jgi:histidinol dehydrogenase
LSNRVNHGEDRCISFGGLRVDEAVTQQVLDAISRNAVEAALEAADQIRNRQQQQRKTLELEVGHAVGAVLELDVIVDIDRGL